MTSPVNRGDTQISRSLVGTYGKRERVDWEKESIWGLGHLQASVVCVSAWGRVPARAQSPLRVRGDKMELGPFSRASCKGHHAERWHGSLTSFASCVSGPPLLCGSIHLPAAAASQTCPWVTSEQAGGAREANPLLRGNPGHGAALLAGYTCFHLALALFAHPGPLLSARG